jgi:hypothetical protein
MYSLLYPKIKNDTGNILKIQSAFALMNKNIASVDPRNGGQSEYYNRIIRERFGENSYLLHKGYTLIVELTKSKYLTEMYTYMRELSDYILNGTGCIFTIILKPINSGHVVILYKEDNILYVFDSQPIQSINNSKKIVEKHGDTNISQTVHKQTTWLHSNFNYPVFYGDNFSKEFSNDFIKPIFVTESISTIDLLFTITQS